MAEANEFVSMEQARAFFPGNPPRHRLYYWARVGLANGAIRLEHRSPGQNLLTTRAWCLEFQRRWDEYRANGRCGRNGHAPETPAQAKRRRARTKKQLDAKVGV